MDVTDVALLAFRVSVGLVFLLHGYNHLFGGGKIPGTARWFESLGMRPGAMHAWLASITEIVAGVALVLGVGMPFACAGVIATMVVAWTTSHAQNGFFIFRPGEGYEYVMTLTFAGVLLAGTGAGSLSIDHVIGVFDPPGWPWFALALGLGFGGAAMLLAVFWRPLVQSGVSEAVDPLPSVAENAE